MTNVNRIDKAIDDILSYSYQHNLEIVGVPQIKEKESAYETTNLCLKMFTALGNDILALEIDIAHRVQQRAGVIQKDQTLLFASLQEGLHAI